MRTARETATEAAEAFTHGWGNTLDWWPEDRLLRSHGFKIEHRPRNGPARWSRKGDEMDHDEALRLVRQAIREVTRGRR